MAHISNPTKEWTRLEDLKFRFSAIPWVFLTYPILIGQFFSWGENWGNPQTEMFYETEATSQAKVNWDF